MAVNETRMFDSEREKPVLTAALHAILILTYIIVGASLGGASYYIFDYSIGVSMCLGGLFATAAGLLHLAFTPKTGRLSRNEAILIRNEFQAIKQAQTATVEDIEALRAAVTHEARARDAALTSELRDLATLITQFAQKTNARAAAGANTNS